MSYEYGDKTALQRLVDNIKGKLSAVALSGKYSDLTGTPDPITVDSSLSDTSENPVQNKVIKSELDKKMDDVTLATVATSGSYSDLSDTPTVNIKVDTWDEENAILYLVSQ